MLFNKFIKDQSGATALEYGLLASLIAVVIIAGVSFLGKNLNNTFNKLGSTIGSASN
ncbi:MAG: Flp family type IVb pilin [Cytophagales bacterium]